MDKKQQSGFTLIELVVVIVILGILAATALPKFIDLSTEAKQAALDGVAGSMSSAMAINYAGCSVKGNAIGAKCIKIRNCTDVAGILQGGALPTGGYGVPTGVIAFGGTATCDATLSGATTAHFLGIGAGTP